MYRRVSSGAPERAPAGVTDGAEQCDLDATEVATLVAQVVTLPERPADATPVLPSAVVVDVAITATVYVHLCAHSDPVDARTWIANGHLVDDLRSRITHAVLVDRPGLRDGGHCEHTRGDESCEDSCDADVPGHGTPPELMGEPLRRLSPKPTPAAGMGQGS